MLQTKSNNIFNPFSFANNSKSAAMKSSSFICIVLNGVSLTLKLNIVFSPSNVMPTISASFGSTVATLAIKIKIRGTKGSICSGVILFNSMKLSIRLSYLKKTPFQFLNSY